jgi:hypothetical protein
MANSLTHARLPYPIANARYTLEYVGLDADGDPTDPTTPDTEVSQDGAAFADAAEEVTTISGSNGCGYVTLTGAETNNSLVWICFKVSSGPKATVMTLRPRGLAAVGSGTLSAGSAGGGTLGTLLAYDVTGCFLRTTGGTGGGGTGGANNQARRMITYNTGTGAFTVSPNWETTPDATTTYDVLLPEGVTLGMLRTLNPTSPGRTLDVSAGGEAGVDWANVGSPTTTLALTGTTIATTQKVDVETIKTNPVANGGTVTFPTNATLASTTNITAGTITTVTTTTTATNVTTVNGLAAGVITAASIAADAITAAKIADGAIDTATFASGCTVPRVTLTDALTTYTGNTVQTGDSFARIGSTGSGLTSLAPSSTALTNATWTDAKAAFLDAAVTSRMATYTQPAGFLAATFPSDPADQSLVIAATDAVMARLGTPAADIAADIAAVKSDSAAILDDTGTSGVAVASASKTGYSLAAAGLDAVAVESGLNARQALSVLAAALAGVLAGGATATITIKGAGVNTTRVTATVDADGNRSAVTLNLPS